nr:hypothetical protein [Tanacetum cinerariifolium]
TVRRPQWMFPFERYMKKLKGYVRTKAKLKGSIAEGYVAEEALTFSSHYFRVVTTKLNRPDRNVDPPPPTSAMNVAQLKTAAFVRWPDKEMYYGQLQEILEFKYLLFKVVLFRVKWFDTQNQRRKVKRIVLRNNMTQIDTREDDLDIIHFDNSSDLLLSTSLNDLDNVTLHIDGQSTEVDAPPDIIDVVDEDDDIIDDEDALPHDLADSDDEDLINVDDDDPVLSETAHGIPRLDRDPRQHPAALAKSVQYLLGCFQGPTLGTLSEPLKIGKTRQRARSYLDRDLGRLLAFEMRWQSSTTQEYPSLIDTFYVAHTINGKFLREEERCIYFESGGASRSGGCADDEVSADDQDDEDEDGDGDT